MHSTLSSLLDQHDNPSLLESNVISWGSPVPSFGDLTRSVVATLGLNPSNREFVDSEGRELEGEQRRFHTLSSLGISNWADAEAMHIDMIIESCKKYFHRNPYNGWFRSLEDLISGTNISYYENTKGACHLDLIPYATSTKWTDLTLWQRKSLLELTGDTLALLLKDSPIQLMILNGRTVVDNLERISGVNFEKQQMPDWTLPRKSGSGIKGYAYTGLLTEISNVVLGRSILILGYNHNIQSSFGVTNKVRSSIRKWIMRKANGVV